MNEISDLLERIGAPATEVSADIARGERALRRRRGWQVFVAATAVAAVAAGGLLLQGAGQHGSEAGYSHSGAATASSSHATHPTHAMVTTPHRHDGLPTTQQRQQQIQDERGNPRTQALLEGYRDVLADHLGALGVLGPANGEWGRSLFDGKAEQSTGTHIDWDHGGEIMVGIATSWSVTEWPFYPAHGTETTYQGHPARVLVDGDDLYVSVEHGNGQVVTVTAFATYGNNHTSIPTTGLTVQDLLPAAADPRLRLPAYLQ